MFGCPALGYLADRIGRRKPVVLGGSALMLAATLAIFYLPPETFPPYLLAFLLGFGSGAAMIPYSIIKEVNPDHAKGSATGAMNFLVFVMTALAAPGPTRPHEATRHEYKVVEWARADGSPAPLSAQPAPHLPSCPGTSFEN